ncbi:hypothetical protein GE061_015641 [Apolygus lucorum]|uniref:Gustatory receptor n=1 Tax=Apolygus lucorum TaxID=248454 RepID=A0A8S9XLN5_APOLU|nr:hypothetical protein GE061_015641 [Apolygus lucorum]
MANYLTETWIGVIYLTRWVYDGYEAGERKEEVFAVAWLILIVSITSMIIHTCQSLSDEAELCNTVFLEYLIESTIVHQPRYSDPLSLTQLSRKKGYTFRAMKTVSINYNLGTSMVAAYITYMIVYFQIDFYSFKNHSAKKLPVSVVTHRGAIVIRTGCPICSYSSLDRQFININGYYDFFISTILFGTLLGGIYFTAVIYEAQDLGFTRVTVIMLLTLSMTTFATAAIIHTSQSTSDKADLCNSVLLESLINHTSINSTHSLGPLPLMHLTLRNSVTFKYLKIVPINYNLGTTMLTAYISYTIVYFQINFAKDFKEKVSQPSNASIIRGIHECLRNLVEKLSSVTKEDMPNETIYANQIHKHTFTCTKRGETTCRFGIPYYTNPGEEDL